jgi:hypothetical protein
MSALHPKADKWIDASLRLLCANSGLMHRTQTRLKSDGISILGRAHSLVADPLGFNVYAITQSLTEIVLHCLQINA